MKDHIRQQLAGSAPVADPASVARQRLPPGVDESVFPEPLTPAAVLVPLVDVAGELEVLLTRRTDHLKDHPGQISFPGGRVEARDAGALGTALRETEEEIGLSPDFVEVIGYLEPQPIVTGFAVTPVVAFVHPGFSLALDHFEVAEVFQVPLAHFLDANNLEVGVRRVRGFELPVYEYRYQQYRIWGATAHMLRAFCLKL